MFQGKVMPSDLMMGVSLASPFSSRSSSEQSTSKKGQTFTADTECVSTKGKLNCKQYEFSVYVRAKLKNRATAAWVSSSLLPLTVTPWSSKRGQQRPTLCLHQHDHQMGHSADFNALNKAVHLLIILMFCKAEVLQQNIQSLFWWFTWKMFSGMAAFCTLFVWLFFFRVKQDFILI